MGHEIKVMTFNMRCRTEADGPNCFDLRRDKILTVLRRETPDIIGFQEITPEMLAWLQNVLGAHYTVVGHGRNRDYSGEANPIAYRTDRFSLHSFKVEWLSDTPAIPGSRLKNSDQSGCPRIYCCAELVECKTGKLFAFFNTHTDHKGMQAQLFECELLISRIKEKGLPFALTGDFNAVPDSEPIARIMATNATMGTVDATERIQGTFHAFSMDRIRTGGVTKIDYVFTNMITDPTRSYAVLDDNSCGNFYSDHYAVCAYLSFTENN